MTAQLRGRKECQEFTTFVSKQQVWKSRLWFWVDCKDHGIKMDRTRLLANNGQPRRPVQGPSPHIECCHEGEARCVLGSCGKGVGSMQTFSTSSRMTHFQNENYIHTKSWNHWKVGSGFLLHPGTGTQSKGEVMGVAEASVPDVRKGNNLEMWFGQNWVQSDVVQAQKY